MTTRCKSDLYVDQCKCNFFHRHSRFRISFPETVSVWTHFSNDVQMSKRSMTNMWFICWFNASISFSKTLQIPNEIFRTLENWVSLAVVFKWCPDVENDARQISDLFVDLMSVFVEIWLMAVAMWKFCLVDIHVFFRSVYHSTVLWSILIDRLRGPTDIHNRFNLFMMKMPVIVVVMMVMILVMMVVMMGF